MAASLDADVGIIGAGPAGSALAAYLARAGCSVRVFEGTQFPRPHVGESLVPAANRVLRELGLLQAMEAAGFPKKYGAVWRAHGSRHTYDHDWEGVSTDCDASLRFDERVQDGVYQPYTFHVDRARFDHLLLEHARSLGATVHMPAKVRAVDLDADGAAELTVREPSGQTSTHRVRLVVDASGRSTVLGRQLGLRVRDPVFDQLAVHTWFEGYDRGTDRDDHIWIHFLPEPNAWVWQIPITETTTSFGVVTQRRNLREAGDAEALFWNRIARCPTLHAGLRAARPVRPVRLEADYSYAMKQITGDRFLLVGDAARFVDPIFSSGVSVALNSARFAAPAIVAALAKPTFDAHDFADYARVLSTGTRTWHRFISVYYRLHVVFTWFIRHPKHRAEVLRLLQGDVYDDPDLPVLQAMEDLADAVEANPDHPLRGALGDLTSTAFAPRF